MEKFIGRAQILAEKAAKKVAGYAEKAQEVTKKGLDKAEELFDTTKDFVEIKAKLCRKKVELDELFKSYGKLCYYSESDEDEAEKIARSIFDIEEEILGLEKILEDINSEKNKQTQIFCTKCGAEGNEEDLFCGKCGGKLKN